MRASPRPKPPRQLHLVLSLPQAFLCLGVLASIVLWSGAVTGYVVFRDDVLAEFLSRHVAMQRGYEQRLAESRSLLAEARRGMSDAQTAHQAERARLAARIDRLIEAHAQLEEQQMMLARTLGVEMEGIASPSARPASPAGPTRPTPIGQSPAGGPERLSRAQPQLRVTAADATGSIRTRRAPEDTIEHRFEDAVTVLSRIEHSQNNLLSALEDDAQSSHAELARIYGKAGVVIEAEDLPIGGPFIEAAGNTETFERHLHRISQQREAADHLREGLKALPLRSPMLNARMTSDYGNRVDPFLGRLAFHAGIDFRAKTGSPVHATGAGTVSVSGLNGGYGIMVEIEHEHGFSTRYAHLSKTVVAEGDSIEPGQLIGYSGSTGRSTGPHLHYETRRDDAPMDPRIILAVGRSLPADLLD